jgi:hypothetical protein
MASNSDLVGFGKWSELTYQELWDKEPVYCQWIVNKLQELIKLGEEQDTKYEEGESKLKRLAQWIMQTDNSLSAIEPEYECDSDLELIEVEKQENRKTLAERVGDKQAQSVKFYGVAFPEDHAGVYNSWAECKPHVVGVKGVMYKSFQTEEEAEAYVRDPPPRKSESSEVKAKREEARKAKDEAKAKKAEEVEARKQEAKVKKEEARKAKEEAKTAKKGQALAAEPVQAGTKVTQHGQATKKRKTIADSKQSEQTRKRARQGDTSTISTSSEAHPASDAQMGRKPAPKSEGKAGIAIKKAATKFKATTKAKVAKAKAEKKDASEKSVKTLKQQTSQTTKETGRNGANSAAPTTLPYDDDVWKRSEALGMTVALRNLATRAEIVSKDLSVEKLLDALIKADGLVNKAKHLLTSPCSTVEPQSPVTDSQKDRTPLTTSPEKVYQEKRVHDVRGNIVCNLATTLKSASNGGSPVKEEVRVTDAQMLCIKENRECALARRAQRSSN